MELNNLKPAAGGSSKNNFRKGRGIATGAGGTAGRGHKGHKARSGSKRKRNFEGGQMPLQMRLPKFGFRNPARQEFEVINLDQLQSLATKSGVSTLDVDFFTKNSILKKGEKIKILGRGEVTSAISISAHAVSETAKKAIEAKGGSITII